MWDSQDGKLKTLHQKSTDYVSPQNALINCPKRPDICGTNTQVLLENYSQAAKTITFDSDISDRNTCSWLIQTSCGGAPGWAIDYAQSTITDDDVWFHFLEYQGGYDGVSYNPDRTNMLDKS